MKLIIPKALGSYALGVFVFEGLMVDRHAGRDALVAVAGLHALVSEGMPDLEATEQGRCGRVSRTVDKQRPGFRCWPVGKDGQNHGHVPNWHPGLVRPSHLLRAHGRNQQQNQDAQKAGIRLPGPGVLQTQDSGNSRGQVRFKRMSQKNAPCKASC